MTIAEAPVPSRAPGLETRALPPLDLDSVRAQFPALASEWVFLDNAGGSQVLASVADRVREYLRGAYNTVEEMERVVGALDAVFT